jgi:hypothetical protein
MEKNVQLKYRLYRRRNGVFYWQDNGSNKQETLRTTDKRGAERLLNAMNESHQQPTAYDPIRNKPLVQTTGENLLAIIHANGNCVAHYLRRLHNLALDLGWLPWPNLATGSPALGQVFAQKQFRRPHQ